ncbi:MAG: hypothetical protein RR397_04545 [Odoribacter sp.]
MGSFIKIYSVLLLLLLAVGCDKKEIGYLMTEDASYAVDQLTIVRLDTVTAENNYRLYNLYQVRIDNKSPWVTSPIEGILGTGPMYFFIDHVKVIGKGDAAIFSKEVSMMGGGRLVFPFSYTSPQGLYAVSIRVENEGYSKVLEDAFYVSIE